jgi:hypothetical protein
MAERGDSGGDTFRAETPISDRGGPAEWTGVSPRVLRIIKGIHLIPGPRGGWEVRTLGSGRIRRRFSDKSEALSFALRTQREDGSDVVVHRPQGGNGVIKVLEAEPRPEPRED